MLDEKELAREEIVRKPETVTTGKKRWLFKLILIIIIIGVIYYLFTHPDVIMGPVNKLFGKFGG